MSESSNTHYNKIKSGSNLHCIIAPERPHTSGGTPDPETPNTSDKRGRWTGSQKLAVGIIGGLVIIGLGVGAGALANAGKIEPSKDLPVATGEAPTPQSTVIVVETATPTAQLIAAHEIKANQSPEALSENIALEMSNWGMAGSDTVVKAYSDQIRKTADASDEALSKFLDEYTAKQAEIYGPVLFGADYTTNPGVQKALTGFNTINKTVLQNIIASSQDSTPYVRSMTYTAPVISASDVSVSFRFVEKDNAGQGNRVTASVNGATGAMRLDYETINNVIAIKKYTISL